MLPLRNKKNYLGIILSTHLLWSSDKTVTSLVCLACYQKQNTGIKFLVSVCHCQCKFHKLLWFSSVCDNTQKGEIQQSTAYMHYVLRDVEGFHIFSIVVFRKFSYHCGEWILFQGTLLFHCPFCLPSF